MKKIFLLLIAFQSPSLIVSKIPHRSDADWHGTRRTIQQQHAAYSVAELQAQAENLHAQLATAPIPYFIASQLIGISVQAQALYQDSQTSETDSHALRRLIETIQEWVEPHIPSRRTPPTTTDLATAAAALLTQNRS